MINAKKGKASVLDGPMPQAAGDLYSNASGFLGPHLQVVSGDEIFRYQRRSVGILGRG